MQLMQVLRDSFVFRSSGGGSKAGSYLPQHQVEEVALMDVDRKQQCFGIEVVGKGRLVDQILPRKVFRHRDDCGLARADQADDGFQLLFVHERLGCEGVDRVAAQF